ncbi:DUF2202 domain-containing protein [Thermococcus gorgonarius]|uniref:DUF2202 domain-containing protein n=1 Tax=Thermococcus gorgonarius TaxID=71997 RepID=A0A2Z2MF09_THEGO|nr:DUF2202 domain-containing protein [Thermococcus gorgonarius]ASJ00588.1 hypothetical protein A3K92_03410 [Thermococcus gorgonarius]
MRKTLVGFGLLVLGLFGLVLGGAAAYMGTPGANPEAPRLYQSNYTTYYAPLSEEEASGLLYMVEEEKLARDVYLTLYEQTGLEVFERISNSEQAHMDAVLSLIEKYNLTAPDTLSEVGVFQNEELQALYDQLVEQGSKSVEDALKVGALIEETDIKDLEDWIARTDNEDIKTVYSNLMAGSENHLRAFVRNLEAQGVSYTAQVLPGEQVDEILSGETGHNGHGKMMAGEKHGHGKGTGHMGGMNGKNGGQKAQKGVRMGPADGSGPLRDGSCGMNIGG